ncbi:MAG: response regulator [Thermoanaerobaculia bacterium]|nr:response regulator [Thermoanaerobaculia bacterium]
MPITVLVVDDERHVVAVVKAMLAKKGYRVLVAGDGREALAIATQRLPDLVLLDILIPKLDGGSVAQRLRQRPETARIPIVFLTGLVGPAELKRRGPAIAGSYFLAKPFDSEQLYQTIEMALPSN